MRERIHFIGIGGISMSTLAAIAQKNGHTVSGSDRQESGLTKRLEELGVRVFYGQAAENIGQAQRVVFTAAISEDNPELCEARRRGLPVLRRSEYLGEIMKEYPVRIGVSGTHGKSSTTGMLASIFAQAGTDPTVACGAELKQFGSAYILGSGEHFLYEACEYKDSFLDFFPSIAVILNIEMDHVDYFKSMEQMKRSYARSTGNAGAVVAYWNDENVRDVCKKLGSAWVVRAGVDCPDADFCAKNVTLERGFARFDLYNENSLLGTVKLTVPGRHHVGNAVCAAAAALVAGVDAEDVVKGLESYPGVRRRFDLQGLWNGVRVYDDYAHHPTEIAVTLRTARAMLDGGERLFCVFQPHTYSRTYGLFNDFVKALSLADRLLLLPIYAAREENESGVSSEQLSAKIPGSACCGDFDEAAAILRRELQKGDLLLTMGAGRANIVGQMLLKD